MDDMGVQDFRVPSPRAPDARHTIRQELRSVAVFVAIIWGAFLLDQLLAFDPHGLVPRQRSGLIGILTMTFLHVDFNHLLSNTMPLFVLLTLLAGSHAQSWRIVALIVVVGGLLLWGIGRGASHKGASLLIFGLISFLIASGLIFERRLVTVGVAIVVGLMYGMTLVTGILPRQGSHEQVSWEGHLCGAVAGVIVAFVLTRQRRPLQTRST